MNIGYILYYAILRSLFKKLDKKHETKNVGKLFLD